MFVKFLGHACTLIETKNNRIVIDPWIVGPCNVNAWYTLRNKAATKKNIPTDIDYIYISHGHDDHFQKETLQEFNRNIPIYICKFPTDKFFNKIVKLGFKNIIQLSSWRSEKLSEDLEITSIKNPDLMFEDSALLVKSKEGTVFCQTDCKMDFESVKRVNAAKPDIGFFMYSVANWYPGVYNYTKEKKDEISKKRKHNKINAFVNYVNVIKPKYAVAYAGGPLFPQKSQLKLNDPVTGAFGCPDEPKSAWNNSGNSGTEIVTMAADDEITIDGTHIKNNEPILSTNKMDVLNELSIEVEDDLNRRRREEGEASKKLPSMIVDYFNKIISENPVARKYIDMKVQLVADGKNGGEFVLDITKDKQSGAFASQGNIDDWNYFMKIPAHLVEKSVNEELLWETLFLSCRWQADRSPDQWNEHFINLLYDPDPTRITNIYKIYEKIH
jgi:UDP-MurNAc hydroxylase